MKRKTRIEKLQTIVQGGTARKIDGVLVDVMTAKAILTCHGKTQNAQVKKVIENHDIAKVGAIAWKAVS